VWGGKRSDGWESGETAASEDEKLREKGDERK
jgi:hypothetical protein